jgi:tungstate transport system permease protein
MEMIISGFKKAFEILFSFDPELFQITLLTLKVSGLSTLLALLLGLPLGLVLGLKRFPARNLLISLVNAGMGLPPVVVGLFVALFFWRSGPLGFLNLIYTPAAIVIAQTIIALPIVIGFTQAAVQQVDPQIVFQARALGASSSQLVVLIFKEARLAVLAAVMAGFGAVISEVGAVLMVGGNLKGSTRVLTTAIVQETRMGHFEMAIALSLILLLLSYLINYFLTLFQQKGEKEWAYRSWR